MDEDVSEPKKKHEEHEHEHKKHETHHTYMEHEQHKKTKSYETAAWTFGVIAVILAILFIFALTTRGFSGNAAPGTVTATGTQLSADQVKAKTQAYLDALLKPQGQTATISAMTDAGDLYSMKISIAGRDYDSFARKDGSLLFPNGVDLNQQVNTTAAAAAAPTPTVVPKTDKPLIELFVMSHCPYGTQSEKGILPAIRTLGSAVDFKVRFVYYSMHGQKEVNQNLMQYCIQKEQPDKYLNYLACFLNDSAGQGSDSAISSCITSTGVDKTKLDACTAAADTQFQVTANYNDKSKWLSGTYPLFNTDADLNTKYQVQGSPTLVINGVQSNAGRDSASYLKGICDSFTTPPAACQTQLSATSPGPGFGYDSTAAATAAGCGV